MIARRIPPRQDKTQGHYGRLARYVVDAEGGIDPATWTRTAEYILDTKNDGLKVGGVRVTNCASDDAADAAFEVLLTQAKNTRSKKDKNYHMVVSFPPGERPTPEQLRDIEDTLVESIGLADHQRISAVHLDTDCLHLHVAINKVHPTTFRNVEPYYDKNRLMVASERLEIKHGLIRTNHGERANAIIDRETGETVKRRRRGDDPGSSHTADPHAPQRPGAQDMEEHSGQESMERWAKREAKDALLQVLSSPDPSWEKLHQVAGTFGLEIRERGAGLVVVAIDDGAALKASTIDRALSMKALTDKLGPYQPPQDGLKAKPTSSYTQKPVQPHTSSADLYAKYQRERNDAIAGRADARQAIDKAQAEYIAKLKAWYDDRYLHLRTRRDLTKEGRRGEREQLRAERKQDAETRRAVVASQRAEVPGRFPLRTWHEFLQKEADSGNADALAVLRSRETQRNRFGERVLRARDETRVRQVLHAHLKPQTRRNGDVYYQVADGGVVVDRSADVRVETPSSAAMALALTMAKDRFQGQALRIDGDEAFRRAVVAAAVAHQLDIKFDDFAMEAERQLGLVQAKSAAAGRPASSGQGRSATPPVDAVGQGGAKTMAAYIAERNETRERVSDISYTRAWQAEDAGVAVYMGRRRFQDGTEAVLLQVGDETLVKPATAAQAAKASQLKVGVTVQIDERGRFISNRQGKQGPTR